MSKEFAGYGKRKSSKKALFPIEMNQDVEVNVKGQVDPMLPSDKQMKTSMTWLCGSPQDMYESFLLKVLGSILMDGHSSIVYQKLVESGIGLDFSVNAGVDSSTSVNFLTIGLQGVSDLSKFRETVNEIFKEVLAKPFDRQKIEAIIQQLELSKKDHKSDFGLQLLYSVLPGWTNKVDPFDGLQFDETLQRFREDLEGKGDALFKDLISKYIIDKPCFKYSMQGSEDFSTVLEEEEKTRLNKKTTPTERE